MSQTGLTRRRFLHVAGGAVAAGLLGPIPGRCAEDPDAGEPLLRFVQWNDAHVDTHVPSNYRLVNEKLKYLVEAVNAETYFPVPDFVIGLGDMIHGGGGGTAKLQADFALLKSILAPLTCRYYPVIGNHENIQREGDPEYEAPYCAAFGQDRVNYTFEAGGIQFVTFNNSGAPNSNTTEVGRRRDRWLRAVLEGSPGPKILCCHIPLMPVREEAILKKSFGYGSYLAFDDELLKLLDAHAKSIVAVLSGHLHLTGVARRQGVYQIVVSGTASYPCDFASYEVFADRVHVRMHSLPKELLTPDTDIHSKGRRRPHWSDFTDPTHPTHESYVKGNPSERAFDISMKQPP